MNGDMEKGSDKTKKRINPTIPTSMEFFSFRVFPSTIPVIASIGLDQKRLEKNLAVACCPDRADKNDG
jgi:hypothetical protein